MAQYQAETGAGEVLALNVASREMDSSEMIMAVVRDLVKKVPMWQGRLDQIETGPAGQRKTKHAAPKWQTRVDKLDAQLEAELERRRQEEQAKPVKSGQIGNATLPDGARYNRKTQICLYDIVRSISVCRRLIWKAKIRRMSQLGLMNDEIFAAGESHSSGRFCTTLEEKISVQSTVTTAVDVHTILDRGLGTVQRICVDVSVSILKNASFLDESSTIRECLAYVLRAATKEINRVERDSLEPIEEHGNIDCMLVQHSIKSKDATPEASSATHGGLFHRVMSLQTLANLYEDDDV